jgi:hypothetical protein
MLGAAGLGLYLLTRQSGAPAGPNPGTGTTNQDAQNLPTIPQSQTAASYDSMGRPVPYPIGSVVRVTAPPGIVPREYLARVVGG